MYASMKACKYSFIKVQNDEMIKVCKFLGMQIYKCVSMQVWKCVSMQDFKYTIMQRCDNATIRVCNQLICKSNLLKSIIMFLQILSDTLNHFQKTYFTSVFCTFMYVR